MSVHNPALDSRVSFGSGAKKNLKTDRDFFLHHHTILNYSVSFLVEYDEKYAEKMKRAYSGPGYAAKFLALIAFNLP